MATLFKVACVHNGVVVTCSDDYWKDHVEGHHPQMAGQAEVVAKVISDPLAVYQSPRYVNRQLLYRNCELPPPFNRGYMRVVVEYRTKRWSKEVEGLLISAYPVACPDPDEVMIWPTD